MRKVLNFGSLNIDMVYKMPHIVRAGETLSSTELNHYCGGKGLNQSIATARCLAKSDDFEVYHAGMVGSDGDMLINTLKDNNINCKYLKKGDGLSGHAIIQVEEKGQNCIILNGGTNKQITKDMIEQVLSDFGENDIIILQNEISNMDIIIDTAYKKSIPIALNPSPIDDSILKIDINKITYFVINEIEGRDFTGETDPDKICDKILKIAPNTKVVLTIGKDGVVYKDKDNHFKHGIFEVKVVDTTAAGDTFLGYFIGSIFTGNSIEQSLKRATAASTYAVSRAGAFPSIPTIDEVLIGVDTFKLAST